MRDNVIVFEEVYNFSRPLIRWYLSRGYKVYYFRLNSCCKDKRWIQNYIERNALINIDKKYDILSSFVGIYPDPAYDNLDKIFEYLSNENVIIKKLVDLYDDKAIFDVFKKSLGNELQRFYYLNFILHNLNKLFPNKKIYFIPTFCKEGYRINILEIKDYYRFLDIIQISKAFACDNTNIVFPLWIRLVSSFRCAIRFLTLNAKIVSFQFFYILKLFMAIIRRRENQRKHFKFGIMIIVPLRQFANKIRKVDFLIDDNKITKDDVLFISWKKLSSENKRYLIRNHLAYVDGLWLSPSLNSILKITPVLKTLFFKSMKYSKEGFFLDAALLLLVTYLMWDSFNERYHVDNLITHTDFGLQSIARNVLFYKSNTMSWYYIDANNWLNYFINKENASNIPKLGSVNFGYLNYDYLLSWSKEVSEYFRLHRQNIGNYINIGCLWAEHIREIKEDKIRSDFKKRLYDIGFKDDYKLITVFDSTYFDNSITTYEDGINFLKGILGLLEDIPNIFIVFKEKKARAVVKRNSQEMISLLNGIDKYPRCYLPFERMNPSEAIAFSNLTISFPFTSTTFEALSARKKALYYDPSNKFRGTFYDKIPGLVCHNYDELFNRTKELLFNTNDFEYNNYLDEFVKGKVEPYLDGRALTRFRELLIDSNCRKEQGLEMSRVK